MQVINVKAGDRVDKSKEWMECLKHVTVAEELSVELDQDIIKMIKKYKKMNEELLAAFQSAPLTDCGYGVSPIGQARVLHALKCHIMKNDLRLDAGYIGDVTKFTTFSSYIKESAKWLFKFS